MNFEPRRERKTKIHYADELSRDEKEALIAQYREEGWKSIAVREVREPQGAAFKYRYEFELGR